MFSLASLPSSKTLLVTGKGGVGKTYVSAFLAYHAASKGEKVCVIEASAEDQIPPLFGAPASGHQLTEIWPNVTHINLDLNLNFRDFIVTQLGFEALFDKIFNQSMVKSFLGVIPGIKELALLGRVYHMAKLDDQKFDRIIFDGYSSGHFHNLMTTPKAVFDSKVVGTVRKETEKVAAFLEDPLQASCITVALAEPLVFSESQEFIQKLVDETPVSPAALWFNRVLNPWTLPDGTCPDTKLFFEKRRAAQQDVLATATLELNKWFSTNRAGWGSWSCLQSAWLADRPEISTEDRFRSFANSLMPCGTSKQGEAR